MKVVTNWKGRPSIKESHLDLWHKLYGVLNSHEFNGKCYVADTNRGNAILLNILDANEEWMCDLQYTIDEIRQLSEDDISCDLKVITSVRSFKHRGIIQMIFDFFKENGEWPNSREMSVKARNLGNYYRLAKETGYDYIRTGGEQVAGATTRLTVKGISLCEKAEDDLLVFLKVFKIFTEQYKNNPIRPIVDMLELEKSNILTLSQMDRVSLLIAEEEHLFTGAQSSQGKNFTFTIAPSILEFKKVETIQDYLRVQESFRGSDVPITLPYETIELAEGGIVVTPSLTETDLDYDLFISYSSKDREKANKINEKAKEVGLKPFLAPKNIKGGEIGIDKIKDAIRNSAEVVVLVSKNSLTSGWVFAEWGAAWILNKHITPLLYRCDVDEIPDLLKQPQHMDLDDLDEYLQQVLERKNAP